MSQPNLLSERIDFLRGAFSVQVIVAHAFGQALLHPESYDKSDPTIRFLSSTLGLGYLGVTGFFILSGYCIHLSLRSNVRKGGTVKKYVAARATRILPMFFVGLLVAILCEVAMRGLIRPERWALTEPLDSAGAYWNQLWPSLISLQGVFGTFGSYEPSWTISFEIIYYTVWPLFFYSIARRRDDRMRLTLAVSYLICFLWMVGGYGLWLMNGRPAESVLLKFWNIPYGMLTWLFGVVLLIFWRPEWDKLARRLLLPVGGLFLLVTFLLAWSGSSQLVNFLKLPLQLLAFGLLLMVNWRPVVSGELLRWLADLSFPLYVMHGSLQMVTGAFCKTYFPSMSMFYVFILSVLVSILIAGSLGVWLERLFLGWRQRFSSRSTT